MDRVDRLLGQLPGNVTQKKTLADLTNLTNLRTT